MRKTIHRFLCLVGFLAMLCCMSAIETCAMEDILQYSIAGFLWLIFAAANAYWGGLMDKPERTGRRWR